MIKEGINYKSVLAKTNYGTDNLPLVYSNDVHADEHTCIYSFVILCSLALNLKNIQYIWVDTSIEFSDFHGSKIRKQCA